METVKETLTIQTPEHVGFQYALAGVGTRSMAFLVDTVIRGLLILSVFVVFMLISKWFPALSPAVFADLPMNWIIAVGVLAYGVLDLGYFLIFEAMWSGQTPGKRFQKLRAIRIDGQPSAPRGSSAVDGVRLAIEEGVVALGLELPRPHRGGGESNLPGVLPIPEARNGDDGPVGAGEDAIEGHLRVGGGVVA